MLSINSIHDKTVKNYITDEENLEKKEKKLKQLKTKLEKLNIFDPSITDLERDIFNLSKEINDIKSCRGFVDYISKVSPVLLKKASGLYDQSKYTSPSDEKLGMMKYINSDTLGISKTDLLKEYMEATQMDAKKVSTSRGIEMVKVDAQNMGLIDDTCNICKHKMIVIKKESSLSCPNCGNSFWFFDTDIPQWSDTVDTSVPFSYERISHFVDHLKQFQGLEKKTIPDELINDIILESGKMHINPEDITREHILNILKKLKKSTYYSNINSILYKVSGKKPPRLPPSLEERLIALFKIIQKPFEMHKPKDRKNFFSYSYVIRKMLEIISIKEPEVLEYIQYFPLLKSRDKILLQDAIWKNVCKTLNWTYRGSI